MVKIYRRDNLVSGVTPKKKNEKNRKRSVIVNFRVTPEEKQLIDERIALSGLPRAEFFIQSCMYQKVITFGNVKTFGGIKKKLVVIDEHLQAVEKSEELDLEILESLRMILEMFAGLEREDWLLFIIVIVGAAGAVGVFIIILEKKVMKVYRDNCWDVISVGIAVISLAVVVYFGDWIKVLVKLNLVALLLLVQVVYVGIRAYVKGCKRARGYY